MQPYGSKRFFKRKPDAVAPAKPVKRVSTARVTNYLGRPWVYAKPTAKHRPAVWDDHLGMVWAMNDAYECRWFEYDWVGACLWAGVDLLHRAPRCWPVAITSKAKQWVSKGDKSGNPKPGKRCLWVIVHKHEKEVGEDV